MQRGHAPGRPPSRLADAAVKARAEEQVANRLARPTGSISDALVSLEGPHFVLPKTNCIFDNAFAGCSSMVTIDLPTSLASIGARAFHSCHALCRVRLPDSVTLLGPKAFCNCTGLSDVQLPANLQSICESTFEGCVALTHLQLPDKLVSIGVGAFAGCSTLSCIELPATLHSIQGSAFAGCKVLCSVAVPALLEQAELREIGIGAFHGCPSLDVASRDAIGRLACGRGRLRAFAHPPPVVERELLDLNMVQMRARVAAK